VDGPIVLVALVVAAILIAVRAVVREDRRMARRTPAELEADRQQVRYEAFREWLEHPDRAEKFFRGMETERAADWRRKFRRYVRWRQEGRDHDEAFMAAEFPIVDDEAQFPDP
jgi:hypothetical protein